MPKGIRYNNMKIPIYILINAFFLSAGFILAIKFIFSKPKTRNVHLYDEQRVNAVLFVMLQALFGSALSLWTVSPMDAEAWEYPAQQLFYIAAENTLAIIMFIKLFFYNFPRRYK